MLDDLLCAFRMKLYRIEVDFKNGSKVRTWVKGRSYARAKKRFYSGLPMRLVCIGANDVRGFSVKNINLIEWKYST